MVRLGGMSRIDAIDPPPRAIPTPILPRYNPVGRNSAIAIGSTEDRRLSIEDRA